MRITLCIGCNNYDFVGHLNSAEQDASRIFDALLDKKFGRYDQHKSRLLLSPDLNAVRQALEEILYNDDNITDFTVFFAGHACVTHDGLYLAVRDTKLKSIAISGLGFGDLSKIIVSARPSQANFVLDACNTAGLGFDLSAILRQSLTGTSTSTGVAALAAAAANEYAIETPDGGVFTSALLNIINGSTVVQRGKPFLGIPDIGSALFISNTDEPQTVSTWVLNLQGANRFSFNPNYAAGSSDLMGLIFNVDAKKINLPKDTIANINKMTLSTRDYVDEIQLCQLLEEASNAISVNDIIVLFSGLEESMSDEARASDDPFGEARILSVFIGQILRYAASSDAASTYLRDLIEKSRKLEMIAAREINQLLTESKYSLLSNDALSDLFFLPIRTVDVLGRTGFIMLDDTLSLADADFIQEFASRLLNEYGSSIIPISEEQACPALIFVVGCVRRGWIDLAEEFVGRMFSDLIDNFARVARHFINGDDALKVIDDRHESAFEVNNKLYHRPSDLVTVVIVCAALPCLDEAVDRSLILIDHTPLNVFLPDSITRIGASGPIPEKNFGLNIGHGVWRCIDIRRAWSGDIVPLLLQSDRSHLNYEAAAVIGALALRDRIPWVCAARTKWPSTKQDKISFS